MYNHLERFLCNYYGQTSPYEHLHNMFITGMRSSSPYCTCSSSEYNKDTQNCSFVVHINKVQLYGNVLSNCTFLFHCFKFIARIRIRIKKISAKQQICLSKSRCTCTLYDITHSIHVYLFNQVGGPYQENIISA